MYDSAQISPLTTDNTFLVKMEYKDNDKEPRMPKMKPAIERLPEKN